MVVFSDGLEALSILDDGGLVGSGLVVLFIRCSGCISWINLISLMLMRLMHFRIMTSILHLEDIIIDVEKKIDTLETEKGGTVANVALESLTVL